MDLAQAQRENRVRFSGGFHGQLVSSIVWLVSACVGTWSTPAVAIRVLVFGGFFIYPLTELLIRTVGTRARLSRENPLPELGMQIAFVLPLSMPLLLPVGLYRLNWFYPATMVLLGAHYVPFVFLYGMPMFAALAGSISTAGILIAMYASQRFTTGAWWAAGLLLSFAVLGRILVRRESRVAPLPQGPDARHR